MRLALDVPGDHSVDPRALVAALREAAVERAGGELRARRAPASTDGERVTGVGSPTATIARRRGRGRRRRARRRARRLPDDARVPVRPVKGQVLRLRDPRGPGLVDRTIRGEQAYLVPRGDGRYVLGATMEERGFDTAPTAGGVYELLRDMSELVPGVLELEIEELLAGPAPGHARQPARDRPGALDGLVWAAGHFRNGILLTPVTAELVAGALAGEPLPDWAARRRPAPLRAGCAA